MMRVLYLSMISAVLVWNGTVGAQSVPELEAAPAQPAAPPAEPAQPAPAQSPAAETPAAETPAAEAPMAEASAPQPAAQPEPVPPPPPTYGGAASVQSSAQEQQTYSPEPEVAAEPRKRSTPFDQGTFRLGILLGYGRSYNSEYLLLGLSPAYYLLDGLEVELGADMWLFGTPFVFRLTPGVRYVLHFVPVLKPYVGGFYRHAFIDGPIGDDDSLGVRFGAFYVSDSRLHVGIGAVYEKYLNRSGDLWYPEILFALSF